MRPILITGDSHVAAVYLGFSEDARREDHRNIVFWPLGAGTMVQTEFYRLEPENGVVQTTLPKRKHADLDDRTFSVEKVRIGGRDPVVVVSMPMNRQRFVREGGFQTHVPWSMVKSDDEAPISDRALEAMMRDDVARALSFVRDLKQIGLEVAVMDAPVQFRHARLLNTARPDVILHVGDRFQRFVRAELAAMGIPLITQPPQVIAEDGMMDAAYRHDDPKDQHHGNAAYGKLMMARIKDFVATHYPDPA